MQAAENTTKAELPECLGATAEFEFLPPGAYRSKTPEEIRRLTLIRSLWSSEAKGTLNYKQPHSKGKFVKHLLPGTPHSAPGQPGFSRPINWHC